MAHMTSHENRPRGIIMRMSDKTAHNTVFIDARTLPLRDETEFVVFDLEWNQCPYGKQRENPRLPFEIIDIGAIKLNRSGFVTGTFHCYIKPSVYKKMHFMISQVIGVSETDLAEGESFPEAIRKFFEFCGEDFLLCTWGDQDIYELQRNLEYYDMLHLLPGPLFYADVQKLFSVAYEDKIKRRSLEYAASFLNMEQAREYHRAYDDALYTAEVMRKIPEEILARNFSIDTYQRPDEGNGSLRIRLTGCEHFISQDFSSKETALRDEEVKAMRCIVCGKNAKRLSSFINHGRKQYIAIGECANHGELLSRVRIKQPRLQDDASDICYIERVTRCISGDEAATYL